MIQRGSLSPNAERVLRLLVEHGPMKVREMVERLSLSEATLFRMTKALVDRGLARTGVDGVKSATDSGRAMIQEREEALEVEPNLGIEAIERAPGLLHQIAIELALCAIVARRHQLASRSLPSVLIIGPPNTFKSSIGEAVILLAGGGKLVKSVVPAGKDLLLRRDARGEEVSRCELLTELVVVFDELDKVKDAAVKTSIEQVYMHGTSTVAIHDMEIEVAATSVAVMNPRAPIEARFAARTGLHESLERRLVVVDLEHWRASDDLLGVDWLGAMAAADAARTDKLPRPRTPKLNVAKRLKKTLQVIARGTAELEGVDFVMWSTLAAAATAWIQNDEEAFRFVVWAWAHLAAQRNAVVPDWEVRLRLHFAPKKTAQELEQEKYRAELLKLIETINAEWKGDLVKARKVLASRGLRSLRRTVMKKMKGKYREAERFIELGKWLEQRGVSIATVKALSAYAARLGLGDHPDGARYLLSLGKLEYGLGQRLHAPPRRNNPEWPDPFAHADGEGRTKSRADR